MKLTANVIGATGLVGKQLVQQLLGFSRKQIIAPKILDIGKIINNLEEMINRLISEDIRIVKNFSI